MVFKYLLKKILNVSSVLLNISKNNTTQKLIVLEPSLDTTKICNLKHYLGEKFNVF